MRDENCLVTKDSEEHPGNYSSRQGNQKSQDDSDDKGICKDDGAQHHSDLESDKRKLKDEHQEDGKVNALGKVCPQIDQRVLVPKGFYTFFYTAIGALFPYLPVYFKQLHLTPHETGVLIGVRPLIQFLATPLWGAVADRFCKGKAILLMSVMGWLVSNGMLAMVPESRHTRLCDSSMDYDPKTKELSDSIMLMRRSNVSFHDWNLQLSNLTMQNLKTTTYNTHNIEPEDHSKSSFGKTGRAVDPTNAKTRLQIGIRNKNGSPKPNVRDIRSSNRLPQPWKNFQNASRHQKEMIQENSLETNTRGAKEMPLYLPKPWTVSLSEDDESLSHVLHDNITSEPKVFRFLLAVTIIGTLVSAPTHMMADTATLTSLDGALHKYGQVRLWGSLGWGVGGFSVGAAVSTSYSTRCNGEVIINYFPCFYVYGVAMGIAFLWATQFRYNRTEADKLAPDKTDCSGFDNALKVLRSPQYCFILVIAFYCGSATGFIETFLFWYLHEMGGEQFLFSVINGMNCAAEVGVFLVSDRLISYFGHVNIIYLALVCYSLRFLYFYFMMSPWWVLPAELLQGITTAAFWASCVSYVGLHPGASHTLQGILNGVYMGLGFAAGGFVGGGVVHLVGMPYAFLIYSAVSFLLCLVFIAVNKYHGN